MELREPIEKINYWLERDYGKAFDGKPNFRVVWANDEFEKRLTNYTDSGIQLLTPEVRLLPKYKQNLDFKDKYILERYIPIVGETDLTVVVGYEACWVFRDAKGNYLPPWFDGCRFIIESILAATGHKGHARYTDPLVDPQVREAEITKMQAELFGNETAASDAMAYGSGVSLSTPVKQETEQ